MKRLFFLCVLLTISPGVVGAQEIPVGVVLAVSGRASTSNRADLQGIELAAEQINQSGGVLGRKIRLWVFDNQSTAIGSVQAAKQALSRKVVAVLGASWSDHSLAIAPVLQAAQVPMLSTYSTHPRLTAIGNYVFRVCYNDNYQGRSMARFARRQLGFTKVAILWENGNDYSEELATSFRRSFEQLGGEIVSQQRYLQNSLDYSGLLDGLRQRKPQAIYVPGYEKETGLIIQQAYKMGIVVPFLGGDGWGDTLAHYLGGDVKEAYELKPWHPDNPSAASVAFTAAFRKKYGTEIPLTGGGAALGYDAMKLLADAMQRAGSASPRKIREALAKTERFEGVTGSIRYQGAGDPVRGAVINRYHNSRSPAFFLSLKP